MSLTSITSFLSSGTTMSKNQETQQSEEHQDLESSPEASVSNEREAETAPVPRRVKRQPDPSLATGLANSVLKGRNRVANGPTTTRVARRTSKTSARRRQRSACAFYVIFEGDRPLMICKGWPAARRNSHHFRNRWSRRFDSRADAQDYMDNPSGSEDDEEEEEDE